jgi:hypothetical protein
MVILAMEDKRKGKILMIGLSRESLKSMLAGGEIRVATHDGHKESLEPLGLAEVVIVPCNTEADLLAIIQSEHPNTPTRIDPGLYS